jgi:uncharacterized membrane protein SpoIIM required for sporulation
LLIASAGGVKLGISIVKVIAVRESRIKRFITTPPRK